MEAGLPKKLTGDGIAPRVPFSLRTTTELRDKLERDARRSGRSLAVEAEVRLENSYKEQHHFADPETYRLMLGFALAIKRIENREGGHPWHKNRNMEWENISDTLRQVYDFDATMLQPNTEDENERYSRPIASKEERAAKMAAAGVEWVSEEELSSFQWSSPMQSTPEEDIWPSEDADQD